MSLIRKSDYPSLWLFVACMLALTVLLLSSCAPQAIHGPRNPFPTDAEAYNKRPKWLGGIRGLVGINQARCFGGGIGGCGWNGKANDGPAGPGR